MTPTDTLCRTKQWHKAAVTTVFPTPVSVPVMKNPGFIEGACCHNSTLDRRRPSVVLNAEPCWQPPYRREAGAAHDPSNPPVLETRPETRTFVAIRATRD